MSVVTTLSSTVAAVAVTPCRVNDWQVPPSSTGNCPKGCGKGGAERHDSDLIKLAGRRAHQDKGHRQFVRRSIHRPTDLASRCSSAVHRSCPGLRSTSVRLPLPKPVTAERSNATTSQNILFLRGSSFRETPTCNPFAVKGYITLYEPFPLILFFPYATIMPYGDYR
jgi:hypothetical protein